MVKKKGFTLTELIGVIAVLAIIMSIALSMVVGIRNNVLQRDYENVVGLLEIEAANYAEDTGITTVTVENLIQNGYVMPDDETDIYNPVDNESLNCHLITSVYDNGSYVSTFGEDIGRDENGTCNPYESTVDLVICQYDENFEECKPIESKDADGNDKWLGENVNLGVMYRNGDILKDETISYYWTSTDGNSGNNYTIATNATLINQSIYTARVTFADSTVNETSQAINIDLQAPVIVETSLENIDDTPTNSEWSRGKRAIITASDYSGSGVAGIYAGNATTCNKDLEYTAVDATNTATITLAENINTICVKDKVGNVSGSDYKIDNGKVDASGADWINLTSSIPTAYTRSLTLTGTAQDNKSGLVAYQFTTTNNYNNSAWSNFTKTNDPISKTYNVTSNGTYYFWVKDEIGNVSSKSIVVNNIDRVINSVNVTKSTSSYVTSLTLTGTATDNQAGITRYAWSTSSSKPSSGWQTVSATRNLSGRTYKISNNGTYYFWVQDAVGNVSSKSITVTNIVKLYSTRQNLYSESRQSISDSIRISNMKIFDHAEVDNGRVTASASGTNVYFTASGGRTNWSERRTTCTDDAESYRADLVEGGCSRWSCNRGGEPDGDGYCVNDQGYSFDETGRSFQSICTCSGGRYSCNSKGASSTCPEGYYRPSNAWYDCTYRPDYNGDRCSSGDGTKYSTTRCQFTCVWEGDYRATCNRYEDDYYECDRGDYLEGSRCYYCYEGSLDRWDLTCSYSCWEDYTYWEYNVTIYYYA